MIKQFLGHLHTINHHKWLVTRDCIRVGLISQGLKHDLSKYAPIEFFAGVKYYEGGKRSPINREKEEKGYSQGWLHHKGRNRHHFEYWIDYAVNPKDGFIGAKMPKRFVAEMVIDRISASRNYQKENYTCRSAWEYYDGRDDKGKADQSGDRCNPSICTACDWGDKEGLRNLRCAVSALPAGGDGSSAR